MQEKQFAVLQVCNSHVHTLKYFTKGKTYWLFFKNGMKKVFFI